MYTYSRREKSMKFFIDTAKVEDIKKANELSVVLLQTHP